MYDYLYSDDYLWILIIFISSWYMKKNEQQLDYISSL